jgi:hypothetical protein
MEAADEGLTWVALLADKGLAMLIVSEGAGRSATV